MRIRLPGGIRTTLAVALLLIVGGALGAAYLMVVPSLERRLVDDRLEELQRDGIEVAATYASRDFSQPLSIDQFVAAASILYNARTVVYQVFGPSPLSLRPLADSASSGRPVTDDPVALRADLAGEGDDTEHDHLGAVPGDSLDCRPGQHLSRRRRCGAARSSLALQHLQPDLPASRPHRARR